MHTLFHLAWGVSKHIAFGYLVYSIIRHLRGKSPTGSQAGILLIGAVFPDVVDKFLVTSGVLSYGRSLAHSLITASIVIAVIIIHTRNGRHAALGRAFGVGYILHIPVDMYGTLLTGNQLMDTAFLFWPVVVEYPLPMDTPVLPVTRQTVFGIVIGSGFLLWLYDGSPPLDQSVRFITSRIRTN